MSKATQDRPPPTESDQPIDKVASGSNQPKFASKTKAERQQNGKGTCDRANGVKNEGSVAVQVPDVKVSNIIGE